MPFSPSSRFERNRIEDELRNWTGAGTRMDDRYYSYNDEGCLAKTKPIEDAIIYHPPARQLVRVQGPYVRVIAVMPITMSQLEQFKNVPCYRCYDPVKENLPNEDLVWDNFQMIHSEPDLVYETPSVTNDKKQSLNVGQGNGSPGLNSFGTAIDTLRHLVDPDPVDSYVEELLETKRCLQEQLQEISSEGTSEGDKGKELPLPPTLGKHQMRYLGNWQSIRDVLEQRSDGHPRTNSHRPLGEIDTHLQQNLHEQRTYSLPTNDPSAPSRFSQVVCLKEYLQLNIKVLQDQIDWNSRKINSDELLRDQGASMTPKMGTERGTNTERDSLLEGAHEDEIPFCFHCLTHGHKVYRCTKPGKERAIVWLHQQESIIDYCKKQKQKHQPTSCEVQRLDAIATTRRLTNPDGKDWQEKEMLSHEKQHKEIGKDISQEAKRGMTINSSSQTTPNSHSTQFDKFKKLTLFEMKVRKEAQVVTPTYWTNTRKQRICYSRFS